MNIKLGEKIRTLRKQKNISQEVLAEYLGVTFQAVSKWETESAMPDVALIPAIASFFGVTTDELFDFNLMETRRKVESICHQAAAIRDHDPARAESILREGLKQFPGNEIILNNLLYTLPDSRADEIIDLCKALVQSTDCDEIKYDAYRIMAETYKAMGEYGLCRETLDRIPEVYFTKLALCALLLEGEDMYEAAHKQKNISAEMLVGMLTRLADYYETAGSPEKAAIQLRIAAKVMEAFREDFTETRYFTGTVYEYGQPWLEDIHNRLDTLNT